MISSQQDTKRPRLRRSGRLREYANLLFFLIAVYTLLEMAIPRSVVQQISMFPTLMEGQRLLISRVSFLFGEPQRGNIVVFEAPGALPADPPLIKRLIGLPGETLEFRDQTVYVDGQQLLEPYLNEACTIINCGDDLWKLEADEYFLMGDNRNHSRDSRVFGPVTREHLVGRAIVRWWPPAAWGVLNYTYDEVQ
ncbi:MAG: signal peptidase I [Anaerolineae bacterium]